MSAVHVGLLLGVLAAYFVQRALEWRSDAKLHKLLEHRAAVAKAEAGINAIHMKVFSDAFIEAQQTKNFLPVSAILARVEVMQKAQGLDRVIPPPRLD